MYCEGCGNALSHDAKFCSQCGRSVQQTHVVPHTVGLDPERPQANDTLSTRFRSAVGKEIGPYRALKLLFILVIIMLATGALVLVTPTVEKVEQFDPISVVVGRVASLAPVITPLPTRTAIMLPTHTRTIPMPSRTAPATTQPTNTPEPTATPTNTPTPEPTATSTNTPEPTPDTRETTYLPALSQILTDYSTALDTFSELSRNARIGNDKWTEAVAWQVLSFRALNRQVRALDAPPMYSKVQTYMVLAADEFDTFSDLYVEGVDELDSAKVARANEALDRAANYVVLATQELNRWKEQKYGQMYTQALDATEYSYQALRDMKWVAENVELSSRKDNLSFTHHKQIASLPPDKQDALLDQAITKKQTVRQLRSEVKWAKWAASRLTRSLRRELVPFQALNDMKWVASKIEISSRNENLNFTHH